MSRPISFSCFSLMVALASCAHEPEPAPPPAAKPAPKPIAVVEEPPSPPMEPVMVEPAVGHALAISPTAPEVPAATRLVGGPYTEIVRICVDEKGSVMRAVMLKGSDPALDENVYKTVRKWKFRPYLQGGKPVPFCYPATFVFKGE